MTANEKGKPMEVEALIAAKCPTCGGILSVKKAGEGYCDYCGNHFILRESYQGKSKEIRNYYDLAYAAQEIGDARNAYKYFTKVLELDSNEALAWYGKGVAALGYPKRRKITTTEAASLFKRALSNVAGGEKDQLRETIQENCFQYADSAFEHLRTRGRLRGGNFRGIMALFELADDVLPLHNDQLKRIVGILCAYFVLTYSERKRKVNFYTDRIRETEPAYLNPWEEEEARRRSIPPAGPINWRPCVVVPLVVALIVLALLLGCLVVSLIATLSRGPAPPGRAEDTTPETADVTTVTEEPPLTTWCLVVDVDGGLPLREKPDPESALIRKLEKGETLQVIGTDESGDWREVKTADGSGWVRVILDGEELATEIKEYGWDEK